MLCPAGWLLSVSASFRKSRKLNIARFCAREANVSNLHKGLACIAHPPRRMSDAGCGSGTLWLEVCGMCDFQLCGRGQSGQRPFLAFTVFMAFLAFRQCLWK